MLFYSIQSLIDRFTASKLSDFSNILKIRVEINYRGFEISRITFGGKRGSKRGKSERNNLKITKEYF